MNRLSIKYNVIFFKFLIFALENVLPYTQPLTTKNNDLKNASQFGFLNQDFCVLIMLSILHAKPVLWEKKTNSAQFYWTVLKVWPRTRTSQTSLITRGVNPRFRVFQHSWKCVKTCLVAFSFCTHFMWSKFSIFICDLCVVYLRIRTIEWKKISNFCMKNLYYKPSPYWCYN